uniref:Uncharacterized protein n=1 Tax=Arundo donax TaxID=35708 RepID=A0A0A9HQ13_ARUDO
MIAPLDKNHI